MRVVVGGLIAGIILFFVPGSRSGPACVLAGALATLLLLQLGPHSYVERIGTVEIIALIAWLAGPRAAYGQSLLWYLFGWLLAGSALSFYLRPKPE